MQEQIVKLKGVKKVYQTGDTTITALDTTDVHFETNKLTLIMGPSGSGKTTLLSILGCVIYPTEGQVFYKDKEVTKLKENALAELRLQQIGFVFQQFNLIEPLTALENVMQPLILQGISKSEARQRATQALDEVNMSDRLHNLPRKLSGSLIYCHVIAIALATDTVLILCDEPTSLLCAKSVGIIIDKLQALGMMGKMVNIVTHDLRFTKFAERIRYVEEGKVSNR